MKCTYLLTQELAATESTSIFQHKIFQIHCKQLFTLKTYTRQQTKLRAYRANLQLQDPALNQERKAQNRQWENSWLQGLAVSEQAVTFQLSLIFTSYSLSTYLFIDVNIERPWGQTSNSSVQIRGSVKYGVGYKLVLYSLLS